MNCLSISANSRGRSQVVKSSPGGCGGGGALQEPPAVLLEVLPVPVGQDGVQHRHHLRRGLGDLRLQPGDLLFRLVALDVAFQGDLARDGLDRFGVRPSFSAAAMIGSSCSMAVLGKPLSIASCTFFHWSSAAPRPPGTPGTTPTGPTRDYAWPSNSYSEATTFQERPPTHSACATAVSAVRKRDKPPHYSSPPVLTQPSGMSGLLLYLRFSRHYRRSGPGCGFRGRMDVSTSGPRGEPFHRHGCRRTRSPTHGKYLVCCPRSWRESPGAAGAGGRGVAYNGRHEPRG